MILFWFGALLWVILWNVVDLLEWIGEKIGQREIVQEYCETDDGVR